MYEDQKMNTRLSANAGGAQVQYGVKANSASIQPAGLQVDEQVNRIQQYLAQLDEEIDVLHRRLSPVTYFDFPSVASDSAEPCMAPHALTLFYFANRIEAKVRAVAELTRALQI